MHEALTDEEILKIVTSNHEEEEPEDTESVVIETDAKAETKLTSNEALACLFNLKPFFENTNTLSVDILDNLESLKKSISEISSKIPKKQLSIETFL